MEVRDPRSIKMRIPWMWSTTTIGLKTTSLAEIKQSLWMALVGSLQQIIKSQMI
jgi:hypothetical protein